MWTLAHLTNPAHVVPGFASMGAALDRIREKGAYMLYVDHSGKRIVFDDFPKRSPYTRPIHVPPIPITALLDRKG